MSKCFIASSNSMGSAISRCLLAFGGLFFGALTTGLPACYSQSEFVEPSETVAPQLFQGDKSFPDTMLSVHDDFVEVRVADAIKHPIIRLFLPAAEAALSRYVKPGNNGLPRSIGDFGIRLGEIESIQSIPSINLEKGEAPNAERPFALSLGGKDVYVRSQEVIQWPEFIKALPLESLGFQIEQIDELARQTAAGHELLLQRSSALDGAKRAEATKQLQIAYEMVAGGFATAVIASPTVSPIAAREAIESPEVEIVRLGNQVRQIAVGIDYDRSNSDIVLHAVLVVNDGYSADSVLQTLLDLQRFMLASKRDAAPSSASPRWLGEARIRPDELPELGEFVDVQLRFTPTEVMSALR